MVSLARFLARRRRRDEDLDDELRFHLDARIAEHLRLGRDPDEARRRALAELGSIEAIKDDCRDQRRGAFLESVWRDARLGVRSLRRSPGFAAAALLTLALGVGASTLLFSLADAVLLKPLPFPDPDRLVQIWDTNPERSIARVGVSTGNLVDWRRHNRTLSAVAAWFVMGRTLRTDGDAAVLPTAQVTTDFFAVFGIPPALGRTFTPEETERSTFNSAVGPTGVDPVIVISHRLWRARFNGDPEIVGKTLSLERRAFRIVGVMPPAFRVTGDDVDLWIPWGLGEHPPRDQMYLRSVARLKAGMGIAEAAADLNAVLTDLERELPEANRGWRVSLVPLHEEIAGGARRLLLVLLGGVGLVLLVACANLAGLQLVRATARGRETSLRLALGASRARLVRQHLTESAVLTGAGGLAGVLLAAVALRAMQRWSGGGLPRLAEAALDLRVAAFALLVAVIACMTVGLAPALAGIRRDGLERLSPGARSTAAPGVRRWRALFVGAQVAVACVLLSGAGLLVRSFAALLAVDPGFRAEQVLVLPIFLDNREYSSGVRSRAYYGALLARLAALPGVEAVGGATALPASKLGPDFERPVWRLEAAHPPDESRQADVRVITPGYLDTLGIRVRRGRGFTDQDGPEAPKVVLVNEALAAQVWPGEDPVGRQLVVDYSTAGTYPHEVVGVVGDVRFRGLRSDPRTEIYFPHAQRPYLVMNVALRSSAPPETLIPLVRQALREVDPQQPAHSITPLPVLVGATVARDRFAMQIVLGFALSALSVAVVGLYGVLAYSVRQRVPEIGVRLALGARRRHLVGMVLSEAARMVVPGLALGLVATLATTRLMESLLFGVAPDDAPTIAGVAFVLALTALAAAYLPARRAARVDPLVALRHE